MLQQCLDPGASIERDLLEESAAVIEEKASRSPGHVTSAPESAVQQSKLIGARPL
jgi:hypothetical protein